MQIEAIDQRSPEWFEARKGKVTGSRFPAIAMRTPYSNASDVMREMVREIHGADKEFTGNVATRWGSEHEWEAVKDFTILTGMDVDLCGFVTHDDYPAFGASPDGLIGNGGLLEVKCPYSQKIPEAPDPHYVLQTQWNMFVTGRNQGFLFYWTPSDHKIYPVMPFNDHEREWAIQVATEFLNALRLAIDSPADYLEPPCLPRTDTEWQEAASHWLFCKRELEAAKDDEERAKKALIKLAGKRSSEGYWVRVSFGTRKGSIDYDALCNAHGISDAERDKFRKKSMKTTTVRRVKAL